MSLVRDPAKIDLFYLEYQQRTSTGRKGRMGMRKDSYFEDSKLTLQEVIRLIFYYFLQDYSTAVTVLNSKLPLDTVCRHFHSLKEIAEALEFDIGELNTNRIEGV